MKRVYRLSRSVCVCLGLLIWGSLPSPLRAQNIQVTSATPPAAAQGTTNLDVVIGGSGFKRDAQAVFVLSGTNSTDGVMVNSTTFNGRTQLTANITIADTATIGSFDVLVYSSGRTGKGTGLFSVTAKGTFTSCGTLGTPSGFTLVTTLNYINESGAPQYQPAFGLNISVRPAMITNGVQSRDILVAAVGTGNDNGKMEFFFLDPATGDVLDGQRLLSGGPIQPHITVVLDPNLTGAIGAIGGDLNGDGVPDFAANRNDSNQITVVLGHMDANGILSYGSPITFDPVPSSPPLYGGNAPAMGDLDGELGDELAVGVPGKKSRGKKSYGSVLIYKLDGSGISLVQVVNDPLVDFSDGFGGGLAIVDVTGDGVPDLIVAASNATAGGASGAGIVFVYPSPLTSSSFYTLSEGISGDNLGFQVGAGTLSSSTTTDVIATTSWRSSVTSFRASIFSGPITGNRTASNFDFLPSPGLAEGWATSLDVGDMTGDGRAEVLVGAPNASNSTSCNNSSSIGAAHLYLSNPSDPAQPALTVLQPPTVDPNFGGFGFGVGVVPYSLGNPSLLLVGENGRDLGGVTSAGQVYVYRKD